MAIISAKHKCPNCGKVWSMPVNTGRPEAVELEKAMREGRELLPTVCESCKSQRSPHGQAN